MKVWAWAFLVLACGALASPGRSLDQRIAEVVPAAAEERWLQVPWRSDLLQARSEANQSGKPLFMWLMDGDPLGAT